MGAISCIVGNVIEIPLKYFFRKPANQNATINENENGSNISMSTCYLIRIISGYSINIAIAIAGFVTANLLALKKNTEDTYTSMYAIAAALVMDIFLVQTIYGVFKVFSMQKILNEDPEYISRSIYYND